MGWSIKVDEPWSGRRLERVVSVQMGGENAPSSLGLARLASKKVQAQSASSIDREPGRLP
jgi:hypothetical protein